MAESTAQPPAGLTREAEEAGFYHEAALNSSWTGARLAMGGLSFGFGAFIFAYFYLRSLNSHGMWHPAGFKNPQIGLGTAVVGGVGIRARRPTRGQPRGQRAWVSGAWVALVLGLAAIGLEVWQLDNLPFLPGFSGYASVFSAFWPVFIFVVFGMMVWLEILIMRARPIPEISFVEQAPTYAEAFAVQRFQAALSAFTVVWNYMAVVAVIAWVLFYLVH
jgi:hypothetical protein